MGWGYGDYGYAPYVPVAQRRAKAAKKLPRKLKKGEKPAPVKISGRAITSTFWGQAWCTNLESYSDYSNRLPRGRTYARNGSIVHLAIDQGCVTAFVSGSDLYQIRINVGVLSKSTWLTIKKKCAGKIGSLVELLQGKLSREVMEVVSTRQKGLFPGPREIRMECSCPDGAGMCKHLAAVMYGIGHRLDSSPELLFLLRGVDHLELITQAIPTAPRKAKRTVPMIATKDLGDIFDIEIADAAPVDTKPAKKSAAPHPRRAAKKPRAKKPSARKPVTKKPSAGKPVTKKSAAKKSTATKKAQTAAKTKTAPPSK